MHSRIIQLETHPISETGKMYPCKYRICNDCIHEYSDGWFMPRIADWVGCDEDHNETVNDLIERCQFFGPFAEVGNDGEEHWIRFKEGFARAYFEKAYKDFVTILKELSDKASIDGFCGNDYGMLLGSLEEAYQSEFDWYIDSEETGLIPFDAFVRKIRSDVKYYIGNTADFHF